jgi:hypothetical protein
MRSRVSVLVAAAVILLSIVSAPASASHAGCYVDSAEGWITDNQEFPLPIAWINWGAWDSTGNYIAGRYTQNYQTKTFHEHRSGDEGIFWAVSSGGENVFRHQTIQRAGYGSRAFGFSTYRHC